MSVSFDASAGTWRPRSDDLCVLLFPGTGSAGAPDLRALAASHPAAPRAVEEVLDAVQQAVPPSARWPSMREILTDPGAYGAAAAIEGVPQLAAYTASVAVDRVLRAAGVTPGLAVGQSFGEIAALVCAGAFGVTDGARMALNLVGVLARAGAGGGLGLLEAGEDRARALIDRSGTEPGQVVVACVNAPSVTVVSGPVGPLEQVLASAREAGARAVRLDVPYLSHHPAMAGADIEWYDIIRVFAQRPLRMPVYSPVRGRAYRDDDDLHRALADCIVRPVRLPPTLRAVREAGATVFVEAGAGNALCQCARLTVPGARTVSPLPHRRRSRPRPAPSASAPSASGPVSPEPLPAPSAT